MPFAEKINRIELGDDFNLSALYTGLHAGTHCDAPRHFIEDGKAIGDMSLEAFIGPCKVITIGGVNMVTGDHIDCLVPEGCERVLFRTKGGFIHESAAAELSHMGVKLVGIDSLSIDSDHFEGYPSHKILLNNNVAVLEGLDLTNAPDGDYFLFAPPVNTGECEAAPARAVLISGYIFWAGNR